MESERVFLPESGNEVKKTPNLREILHILDTDAAEGRMMMCQRMGSTLSFYTLFPDKQSAQTANARLAALGVNASIENERKVFLTASFPTEEIDKLASETTSIPADDEHEELSFEE